MGGNGSGRRGLGKYFSGRGPDLRRRPERRTFQVQKMWEIHHEIARMASLGLKSTQIAVGLGVSPAMVNYTLSSPVVQDKVDILRGARDADTVDLAQQIKEFAPVCLELLKDIVQDQAGAKTGASITLRSHTARDLMDRAGYSAVRKHQIVTAKITPEQLLEIKQRARDSGILAAEGRIGIVNKHCVAKGDGTQISNQTVIDLMRTANG